MTPRIALSGSAIIGNVSEIKNSIKCIFVKFNLNRTRLATKYFNTCFSKMYVIYFIFFNKYDIHRGGNAEKLKFDWVIGLLKYGFEVVEWAGGFNKKQSKFHFGH